MVVDQNVEYPNTAGANADFAAIDVHSLAAAEAEPVLVSPVCRRGLYVSRFDGAIRTLDDRRYDTVG